MERKLVTVEKIHHIEPIDGADKIELAKVKGWQAIIRKGDFNIGDRVLFYEVDSFLPVKPEYEFLLNGTKAKKMIVDGEEKEGIRLKTCKLRGVLSQGLVMPLSLLKDGEYAEGMDVSEQLGVLKWEMPIPQNMQGKAKGSFPAFIPKTDEERIQNISDIMERFVVSEKVDGMSTTFYKRDGIFGVCSRNLELEDCDCPQWNIAKELDLINNIPYGIALQGELCGPGIQGNPLKLSKIEIFFFNAYSISSGRYLDYKDFVCLCNKLGVKTVPIVDDDFALYDKTPQDILEYCKGKSLLNSKEEREGVVIRAISEKLRFNNSRFSFKAINNDYLIKNDL